MKKILLKVTMVVLSSTLLISCGMFNKDRPDNSNLLPSADSIGDYEANNLALSSQIHSADEYSAEQLSEMKEDLMGIDCRTVYFGFDSYEITDDAKECLDAAVSYLTEFPDQPIKLSGNTDPRGSEKYNFNLGQKRAEAVYKYMLEKGVMDDQMCAVSFGKLKLAVEPSEFYEEFCGTTDVDMNDSCTLQASEKAYYMDRRTELDFGSTCS